jgi:hypothetical protein
MSEIGNPALRQKLAPHRRSAWLPEVVDGDGPPDGSRLGGAPWLRPGEAWPACGSCGRPMQLFVQLNARDLPPPAAGALEGGLLQFFYCTSDEESCVVDAEPWAPFSPTALVRLVARDDLGGGAAAVPQAGTYPAKRIVSWTESQDYPSFEEADELVGLSDAECDALSSARWGRIQFSSNRLSVTAASHVASRFANPCVLRVRQLSRSRSTPLRRSMRTVCVRLGLGPKQCRTRTSTIRLPSRVLITCVSPTPGVRSSLGRPARPVRTGSR